MQALKTLMVVLFIINAIAWSFTLYEEIQIHRFVGIEATVIESTVMDDYMNTYKGGISVSERVNVSIKYKLDLQEKLINVVADSIEGVGKRKSELKEYYYPGRTITLWINPAHPEQVRLHSRNTVIALPAMFLLIWFVIAIFYYIATKNVQRGELESDSI